jgi:hypothetical protein
MTAFTRSARRSKSQRMSVAPVASQMRTTGTLTRRIATRVHSSSMLVHFSFDGLKTDIEVIDITINDGLIRTVRRPGVTLDGRP